MSEIRAISESLLPALWRASWQGGLVIVVLWCLCRTLERCRWFSADLRCWLWRAAYVKLLVSLAISGSVILPVLPAAETPGLPVSLSVARQTMPSRAVISTAAAVTSSPSLPVAPPVTSPWQTAIAVLYVIGVSVCFSRIIRAGLRTRQMLREASSPKDADAETEVVNLSHQLGLRRVPRLKTSTRITIPVYAAGTVLLPADTRYATEESRLILAHELAHARRRDLVWEWLGTLTQAVFLFHPLVLLARREERLARESAADALALQMTQVPVSRYGKLLLSISLFHSRNSAQASLAGTLGVIDRGTMLHQRLLALKDIPAMSTRPRMTLTALTVTVFAIIVPWQLRSAAPQPQVRHGADAPYYLQRIAALPLIPLAKELGLSPDQKQQIIRLQTRTAQKREKILLRQIAQRRQLAEQYLPGVRAAEQTVEYADASENLRRTRLAEYQKYKTAMHKTIETGQQETRHLEEEASRGLLAILSDKQEKSLPGLLSDAGALKFVGIPVELYSDLALNPAQKERIAAVVSASNKRNKAIISALKEERKDQVQQQTKKAKREDKKGIKARRLQEAQRFQQINRYFDEMRAALLKERQRAFAEALAVLTPSQRSSVTSYIQAHPEQRQSR